MRLVFFLLVLLVSSQTLSLGTSAASIALPPLLPGRKLGKPSSSISITTYLQSHFPASLYKDGGYPHKPLIQFGGIPNYNGSLAGILSYVPSDFCNITKTKAWDPPFILMINATTASRYHPHHNCTLIQQVRNAQQVGAIGVLFGGLEANMKSGVSGDSTDDDHSSDVTISVPSFMFTRKYDFSKIVIEMNLGRKVEMGMSWFIQEMEKDKAITVDLFASPIDDSSTRLFLETIWPIIKLFQQDDNNKDHKYHHQKQQVVPIKFTPYFAVQDGTRLHCYRNMDDAECSTSCTNYGRYCATPLGGTTLDGVMSGVTLLNETLRRHCLNNAWYLTKPPPALEIYHSYVSYFYENCQTANIMTNQPLLDACVEEGYKQTKINNIKWFLARCMNDSGGPILQQDLEYQKKMNLTIVPTLLVNDNVIVDPWNPLLLVRAICNRYDEQQQQQHQAHYFTTSHQVSIPDICIECANSVYPMDCIQRWQENQQKKKNDKKKWWWNPFLIVVFGPIIVVGIFYLCHPRRLLLPSTHNHGVHRNRNHRMNPTTEEAAITAASENDNDNDGNDHNSSSSSSSLVRPESHVPLLEDGGGGGGGGAGSIEDNE